MMVIVMCDSVVLCFYFWLVMLMRLSRLLVRLFVLLKMFEKMMVMVIGVIMNGISMFMC